MSRASESAVRMALDGEDLQSKFNYWDWEDAFISRWDVMVLDNAKYSKGYMEVEKIDPLAMMGFDQAARIFHVNRLRFFSNEQFVAFCKDYDRVAPVIVEEPLNEEDWTRLELQERAFNPRRPGNRVIDMGARKDKSPDNEAS